MPKLKSNAAVAGALFMAANGFFALAAPAGKNTSVAALGPASVSEEMSSPPGTVCETVLQRVMDEETMTALETLRHNLAQPIRDYSLLAVDMSTLRVLDEVKNALGNSSYRLSRPTGSTLVSIENVFIDNNVVPSRCNDYMHKRFGSLPVAAQ